LRNMRIGVLICLLSVLAVDTFAQGGQYALAAIPDNLKTNANTITHLENIEFNVEDLDRATLKVHKIFTVLSENGRSSLFFNEYSSKYVTLEDPEIRVFDALGKQIGKYKKKDMTTVGIGEGLIEDGFVTYYPITTASYPVTVEVSYEHKFKGTLMIPDYMFIGSGEGIVESYFTARVPVDMGLRYKPKNTTIQPVVTDDGKYKIYKWAVKGLAPLKIEEGAVADKGRYPYVALASDKFSHYGYAGDFSSWKNFGTWLSNLYTGLDELTPDREQFFQEMVKNAASDKEKARMIYHYLQNNFRYVSIQLGIGGLKPFSATFTDQKKYGDCKALSNYMKAALKAVGIPSHVAIINAEYNKEPVDPDFPKDGFNHVILCVPQAKDSIWLECTSNTAEFGELGTFTENRYALLITDKGGVLTPTPRSRASANRLISHTTVQLNTDLSASSKVEFATKGYYTELFSSVMKEKKDRQKEILVSRLGFRQPTDFTFSTVGNAEDATTELKLEASKFPEFTSGEKWFLSPRAFKIWASRLPKADNRTLDYYFRFPFEQTDTTVLKLPEGAKIDVLPDARELSCKYATYRSKVWYNDKESAIYSTTSLVLNQHRVSASDYAAVKKFFDDLVTEDGKKLVLIVPPAAKKAF
jgi:hypothetical protein